MIKVSKEAAIDIIISNMDSWDPEVILSWAKDVKRSFLSNAMDNVLRVECEEILHLNIELSE